MREKPSYRGPPFRMNYLNSFPPLTQPLSPSLVPRTLMLSYPASNFYFFRLFKRDAEQRSILSITDFFTTLAYFFQNNVCLHFHGSFSVLFVAMREKNRTKLKMKNVAVLANSFSSCSKALLKCH
jgi:hypothetical protein